MPRPGESCNTLATTRGRFSFDEVYRMLVMREEEIREFLRSRQVPASYQARLSHALREYLVNIYIHPDLHSEFMNFVARRFAVYDDRTRRQQLQILLNLDVTVFQSYVESCMQEFRRRFDAIALQQQEDNELMRVARLSSEARVAIYTCLRWLAFYVIMIIAHYYNGTLASYLVFLIGLWEYFTSR